MLSVFGTNFCSSSAPTCASSLILPGVLSSGTMVYQNWLSMDAVSATQRKLAVAFCPTGTTPLTPSNTCVNAPLLFGSNSQINLLVPTSLSTGSIDILVTYGYGTSTNMLVSGPVTVTVAATDPGTFAIGSDGQGAGAILAQNWSVIGATNPAGMRSTATDSDSVQIYMTGLGVPNSQSANTSPTGGSTAPADCISLAAYMGAVNAANQGATQLTNLDGAVIQSSLIATGLYPPCLTTNPTVTVGTVPVQAVLYAGWVADSVAGLYQVNVTLPATGAGPFIDVAGVSHATITAPVQLPVAVTANSKASQTGISIWVAPRLKVSAPTALSSGVGVAWPDTNNVVIATEGQSPYRYAVTSGVLPTGLALAASGVNAGTISGTPAADRAGTYVITVTATDSNSVPLTGTVTFTLTVTSGLVVTPSVLTYTAPVVTALNTTTTIDTVTATGGSYPYTYSFDSSFTAPTHMLINSSTGAITIDSLTPAGVYNVKVDAVDSTGLVTGSTTFPVTLNLVVTASASTLAGSLSVASPTLTGNAGTSYTVTMASVGGSGYTYSLATPTTGYTFSGNILTVNASATTGQAIVVNVTGTGTAAGTITLNFILHLVVSASAGTGMTGSGTAFSGAAGGSLTVNLAASGGTSYTFSTPSQSGHFTISGNTLTITAPASGTAYSATITATDIVSGATGTLGLSITVGLTVTASAGTGGTTGSGTSFNGPTGSSFTVNLAASGGTSYTFTTPSQGAQFSVSGTVLTVTAPATSTAYTVVINALDSVSQATGSLTLTITVGLTVTATSGTGTNCSGSNCTGLAGGGALTINLSASGGTSYFYSTASQGGVFSITTNVLTIGTSAVATASAAPYSVVILATENTTHATGTITLTITLGLTVTASAGSGGITGSGTTFSGTGSTPYTITLAAAGGSTHYLFSTTDSTGYFSINSNTLNINAPTAPYAVTINVLDTSSGAVGSIQLSITMN
jgi:uncharacterized protein (TIGR03437 family)